VNLSAFDGLIWLVACLLPFIIVQRRMHHEIQAIFLLLTRRTVLSLGLFSFIFLPGVALHEASHFLMAKLLQVPTGKFSLIPKLLPNGTLRMGYLETAKVDPIRDTLIGMAPLLTGGMVVASIGTYFLGFIPITTAIQYNQWLSAWGMLRRLPYLPDFWMWFYLAFAVSSTMLPSASDRRGWLPVAAGFVVLALVAVLAGAGPWMLENLAPGLNQALRSLALVFGISLAPHIVLLIPCFLLRLLLGRITGLEVVSN
jgi:hypothetical protein